ncbi:hypothetical protein TWF225_002734 [Orbilia oligospora]|nr:hypothetical protein TWF225_002734 [Orbilia oligospora]
MHLPTLLLTTATTVLSLSSAKIIIGNLHLGGETYTVAWNPDDNPCDTAKVLGKDPANPCGVKFDVKDYSAATLEGCGGPLWINIDGHFRHNCRFDQKFVPTFCANPGGGFGLDQVFRIHQGYVCE